MEPLTRVSRVLALVLILLGAGSCPQSGSIVVFAGWKLGWRSRICPAVSTPPSQSASHDETARRPTLLFPDAAPGGAFRPLRRRHRSGPVHGSLDAASVSVNKRVSGEDEPIGLDPGEAVEAGTIAAGKCRTFRPVRVEPVEGYTLVKLGRRRGGVGSRQDRQERTVIEAVFQPDEIFPEPGFCLGGGRCRSGPCPPFLRRPLPHGSDRRRRDARGRDGGGRIGVLLRTGSFAACSRTPMPE